MIVLSLAECDLVRFRRTNVVVIVKSANERMAFVSFANFRFVFVFAFCFHCIVTGRSIRGQVVLALTDPFVDNCFLVSVSARSILYHGNDLRNRNYAHKIISKDFYSPRVIFARATSKMPQNEGTY